MNLFVYRLSAAAGAFALLWVALGFGVSHPVALAVTLLIAGVWAVGVRELHVLRQQTRAWSKATGAEVTEAGIEPWLDGMPGPLRAMVRLRLEGERAAWPGPALTPYLLGLLVMLGMLGTFVGLVLTLKGTVFALEGSLDLQAMRAAFAAPMQGLGLAFGTSVAGVASSAALGLMATLCRRERAAVAQQLEARLAGDLRPFTARHRHELTQAAWQAQAQALPEVVLHLQTLAQQLERRHDQLGEQLRGQQAQFHEAAARSYTDLAQSVQVGLQQALQQAAQTSALQLRPVFEHALGEVADQARQAHERLAVTAQGQLQAWLDGVDQREQAAREHRRQQDETQRQRMDAALTRLQAQAAEHLTQLGQALEGPMTRLIDTASQAPRAAVELMGQLRQEVSAATVRDNELLDERRRTLEAVQTLLQGLDQHVAQQRSVMDRLMQGSQQALEGAVQHLRDQGEAQAQSLRDSAVQLASHGVELNALSDTLQLALRHLADSQTQLMTQLQGLEGALSQSMARSDEQMAYYVAQARELIDLSLSSQKQVLDGMRTAAQRSALSAVTEVA